MHITRDEQISIVNELEMTRTTMGRCCDLPNLSDSRERTYNPHINRNVVESQFPELSGGFVGRDSLTLVYRIHFQIVVGPHQKRSVNGGS